MAMAGEEGEERLHTWSPIKEAMDELWRTFLGPPIGRDLEFFCKLMSEYDQRFRSNFLENFILLFNSLRGSHSVDSLPPHLVKILNKVERNHDGGWNPKADPEYLVPQSLMLKLFHHVRDKIKERERGQRTKERTKERHQKVDEAHRLVVSLDEAIDDLWIAFLTPPRGSLRSLIAVLIDGDSRFPSKFLDDFLEIFNHLSGFNTNAELVEIFQDVEWNPLGDPEYKLPQRLMLYLFEDVIEDIGADLGAEKTKTSEEIEQIKIKKRKAIEDFAKTSAASKKIAYREGRLGREVAKKEARLKIISNMFKNTLKKPQ